MSLRKILLRVKGKIAFSLLISFFSLILCFILGSIISYHTLGSYRPLYFYEGCVELFLVVVFPFFGAYVGFCLCYSGKLYVKKRGFSALIVPALFGIVPIMILFELFPTLNFLNIELSTKVRPIDSIIMELNRRENFHWASVKISGRQFQTDAKIEKEIVYGKTHSSWDMTISGDSKCGWMKGCPTPKGGDIICNSKKITRLIRTAATLAKPATWDRDLAPFRPMDGQYKCTQVNDGDTITFINNSSKYRINLIGIDAPEIPMCENQPEQPFSRKSAEYLARIVLNKKVKIVFVLYGTEKYNRTFGAVSVAGKNVNLEMIKAGLAEVDRERQFPGFDLKPYLDAEKAARNAGRGMWSLGDRYMSPRE